MKHHKKIRTVIADDSPLMLKLLAQTVKGLGDFELVGSGTDGVQALRQVLALTPDLVLIDIDMPHLNGIRASEYIKRFQPPPIVVLVTADNSARTRATARAAGVDAVVAKGADLRGRLIRALSELFTLHRPGRPESYFDFETVLDIEHDLVSRK
jgi:DNA-binding NarL/FixJ family response regulator